VFYVPAADYNGSDSFNFKANDGTVDSAAAAVSITVTAVNDAPVASAQSVSTAEDTGKAITLAGTDADNDPLTFKVTSLPAHGDLYVGSDATGHHIVAGDLAYSLSGSGVFYVPAADYNGSDSFNFKANDGTVDSAAAAVSITVTSVNDAPSGADKTVSTDEDTAFMFAASDFGFSDTSDSPANALAAVKITTLPAAGSLTNNGTAVAAGDEVSKTALDAGKLVFTPAANANGAGYASFNFKVRDDGGTGNGGVDLDPAANTITVDVTSVNDAPSFTKGGNQTVLEDAGPQSVAGWATSISAGPANESSQAVNFIVTNNNNSLFTAGGQPSVSATGTLTFTSAPDANGSATVTVKIHDDGGTANSGVDNSPEQTFTITVTAVNDAPTVTPATAAAQSVQYSDAITNIGFAARDIDNTGGQLTPSTSFTVNGGSAQSGLPAGLGLTLGSTTAGTPSTNDPGQRSWTLSGTMNVAPGTYEVRLNVSDGSTSPALAGSAKVTITVGQEDADITYTGNDLYFTSSINSTTANVTLTATIVDRADGSRGDIRNARVTVYDGSTALCSGLTPALVSGADLTIGTVSCAAQLSTGTSGGTTHDIWFSATGSVSYYKGTSGIEEVTVAQPIGSAFITGGGYLINPATIAGQYAGDPGARTNFGFNVKYNKSLTNLQGNVNVIVRRGGAIYQFKSNSLSSLVTKPCSTGNATPTCPATASFQGKANGADVTNPLAPIPLGGNLTLQMTLTDRGEPGASDSIGITVYNGNTLLFSSQWSGTKTQETVLSGGNLVVH
jgi:hypothetical protein